MKNLQLTHRQIHDNPDVAFLLSLSIITGYEPEELRCTLTDFSMAAAIALFADDTLQDRGSHGISIMSYILSSINNAMQTLPELKD